ncbi:hypothetical protein A4H97_31045 [Niastella yeongjuensis]|uniref:Uncharacterized protein n=1 Tax=Niastella yeongjuensis TaxID=354355 RepID=A0A1V9EP42_9BACT|nr:hypothetical protein [Niastella yeongjuensis]OQP47802.1 hypothetical protein A4H97_31045 [Niastella yeongjuensis]SEP45181.1 hypothetical protein SAMN05660816_06294 [Niastella yeongjuensis]
MYKFIISLLLIITSVSAHSQEIAVQQLIGMLDWTPVGIDTTLKKDGYLLMQKDVDSTSSLFQYSWFDKQEDGKAVVRSFIYADAAVRNLKSRLITYRTYKKEEYQEIAAWLLANNYHSTAKFDFKEAQHTLYSNGTFTIRVKVITTALKDGRKFIAYELELGK